MNTKIYVGNISFDATGADLESLFAEYGTVTDVHMVTDRETGRPRGFAFVTMGSPEEMEGAIGSLNGQQWMGRNLTVNEARPREDRGGGGGGGRGRGGGGRDRY